LVHGYATAPTLCVVALLVTGRSRRTLAGQARSSGSGCCRRSPLQPPVTWNDEPGAGRQ
jgi:hypothetical protein